VGLVFYFGWKEIPSAMLRARELILRLASSLFILGSFSGILVNSAALAAPLKSIQQDNVVISEVRFRGPNGNADEFIEIFNPTGSSIDISGWEIWVSNNAGGTTVTPLFTFPDSTELQTGQHYLIANSTNYSEAITPDGTFTTSLPDEGGIALTLPDQTPIDQVATGDASLFKEGDILAFLSDNKNQGYERLPGGSSGNCTDTDDNKDDFILISPSDPQNTSSPLTTACIFEADTPTDTETFTQTTSPTIADTETYTQTSTNSPTSTATIQFTNTSSPTTGGQTPTSTPTAPKHMVISEFRSRGPNGATDEFIELYNPTGAAVDIGGWTIKRSSGCGKSLAILVTIADDIVLEPGQHYLVAETDSSVSDENQTYSGSFADDGGLALVNTYSSVVDQVGMCSSTGYLEGTTLPPLSDDTDQSYERKPGGDTSCYDTGNNSVDFSLISPSNLQNLASSVVMCSGVQTYTPTRTPTRTSTRTSTRTPTSIPRVVVINEFLPHPQTDWNGDGSVNTEDEFIELINVSTDSVNLKGWKLGDSSGSYTLTDLTLTPRQIVVFFHAKTGLTLSDAGDTVRLLNSSSRIMDVYTYPVVTSVDRAWCRLPDGSGSMAFTCLPSPGKPNVSAGIGKSTLTTTPEAAAVKNSAATLAVCYLDSVPAAVIAAECESPGKKVWGDSGFRENWLESHWKWGVFVE
jgi:hypothetical protein